MRNYIRLSPDVVIEEGKVIAIVKNREKVATDTGIVEQTNMFIYLEASQIPIVITTKNKSEADEFERILLGEWKNERHYKSRDVCCSRRTKR